MCCIVEGDEVERRKDEAFRAAGVIRLAAMCIWKRRTTINLVFW
jgi:hypothetical protein